MATFGKRIISKSEAQAARTAKHLARQIQA